jgi:hypothetical protein
MEFRDVTPESGMRGLGSLQMGKNSKLQIPARLMVSLRFMSACSPARTHVCPCPARRALSRTQPSAPFREEPAFYP